jgi:RNA polymerase sigma factor for flagellar operon FliA
MSEDHERTPDQLWRDFKDLGDPGARDQLVVIFAPLVRQVAARIKLGLPRRVDLADLVSDGIIGLMDAVERFEPERGLQFRTFAVPRIRGAIIDGLRASDWAPRSVREKLRDLQAAVGALERRHARSPDEVEVAGELGVTSAELHDIRAQGDKAGIVSLEAAEQTGKFTPHALVGPPGDDADLPDGFIDAVRGLPKRQQIVIALYYWERFSLKEIGHVLGVSESRASQLHRTAITALGHVLPEGLERPY